MARGSLKKRKDQNRSITLLSSPPMSKTPPTSSRFSCRRTSMSFLLLSSFTILLIYSTSKTTFFVSSTEIYSFEVINEFPHDPNAFTETNKIKSNIRSGRIGPTKVREIQLSKFQVPTRGALFFFFFNPSASLFKSPNLRSMARGSLKQRKNQKRSIIPPSSSSMAKTPPPASPFNCRRISISFLLLSSFVFLLIYTTTKTTLFSVSSSEIYSIEVVNEYPHDPNAFTQGLLYGGNDTLFESTGLYGESSVRQVILQTGEVLALHHMDGSYFGEGLTMLGGRLFQVTWQEKTGFIYDRFNLSKWTVFTHQMRDGWGLATDGKVIFGSDGSSTLYRLGPKSLKVMGKVTVTYKGREIFYINELEYINGEVWANVWQTDCIARISPKDGEVLGWIVLDKLRKGLVASGNHNIDVLNGIAWDRRKNRLFVTGKKWPKLYEIKVQPVKGSFGGKIEELCLPRAVPGVPS